MAKVLHTCTDCVPIDASIIDTYVALIDTEKRVRAAEEGRVAAENERERISSEDHTRAGDDHTIAAADHVIAVDDHGTAGDDHTIAVADHGIAGDDHTIAAGDHVTAGEDHIASDAATTRANNAAAAAEHQVDIKRGISISSITENLSTQDGGTNDIIITLDDGTVDVFHTTNGHQGNTGSSVDYPYELVNNVTTDDAEKGLSAAMGKYLNEKFLYDKRTIIVSDLSKVTYAIVTGAGNWVGNSAGNTRNGSFIDVVPGDVVKIVGGENAGQYSLLTEHPTSVSAGGTPPLVEDTIRYTFEAEETVVVTIPDTCYCMNIMRVYNNVDNSPSRIAFVSDSLADQFDGLEKKIGDVAQPWKQIDLTNTPHRKFSINSSGSWAAIGTTSDSWSTLITLTPGKKYRVVATANEGGYIAVLAQGNEPNSGSAVFATGYSGRLDLWQNRVYEFTAPANGYCLYALGVTTSSVSVLPTVYEYQANDLEVRTDNISGRVSDIEEDMVGTTVASSNIFDMYTDASYFKSCDSEGVITDSSNHHISTYLQIKPNTVYTSSNSCYVMQYDANKQFINRVQLISPDTLSFTTTYRAAYIRLLIQDTLWAALHINEGETLLDKDEYRDAEQYNRILNNEAAISVINDKLFKDGKTVYSDYVTGGYILIGEIGTVATINSPTTSAGWKHMVIPVHKGETYYISGRGGVNPRLWAILNENKEITARSSTNKSTFDYERYIPVDGYLVCNFNTNTPSEVALKKRVAITDEIIGEASVYDHSPFVGYRSQFVTRYVGLQDEYASSDELGHNTKYATFLERMDGLVTAGNGYITKTALGQGEGVDENDEPYTLYDYAFIPSAGSSTNVNGKRPVVLIDACIHGFEKTSFYGWYYFFKDLVENFTKNTALLAIRSSVEIHFIPAVNPWGVDNDSRNNYNGVNLNRNFDVPNWEEVPSGSDASGAEPFDQAETAIVRDWAEQYYERAIVYLNTHTNGHYNADGWVEANHCIPIGDTADAYYNRVYNAIKLFIEENTAMFRSEYNLAIPYNSRFGQVRSNPLDSEKGLASLWSVTSPHITAFTLEGFNGLVVDEATIFADMRPLVKKVNSEIFGNMLLHLLAEYIPQ